jgi:hypothetical protein
MLACWSEHRQHARVLVAVEEHVDVVVTVDHDVPAK